GLHGSDRHPGKHLSGKQNLKGRLWPVNLLHLEDAIAFTQVVIKRQLKQETFVVVGDHHPTREEYYTEYCRQHGLDLPHFDPSDYSQKEAISNEKASRYYNFRF